MTQKFRSRLELHSIINGQPAKQILAAASDVCVREQLNGQYYVTFIYPRLPDDKSRYDALAERNEIKFPDGVERGQRFVIKRVDEERRGLRIFKRIEAHHMAFELNRYYLDDFVDFSAAQPPDYTLGLIGNGTPYTMAVNGTFDNQDVFDFGEKRKHDLLAEVRTLYNGELAYDDEIITLTTRKGGNYGVEIRYRKNLTGIVRKSHDMERITRLYGYGKNGLTIEGHAGHSVKYIDSQYADAGHLFEGSVDFPEIDDQARLLDAMQRHLLTVELPKVSYEIDFVQLEKVDVDFRAEAINEVGDTITIIDESMGYRFDARVTEYERYPFEPKRGRVVLANFRELKTSDYVWMATVGSKRAMKYTSDNAVLKGTKYDDSITLVDGFGMAVSDDFNRTMVRLGQTGPGEYGLALFNKSGVRTIWQDSATGNAYFSGTLQAANGDFTGSITATSGTIGGWTINATSLSGSGTISGGTITGSSVNGGSITGTSVFGSYITGGTITGAFITTSATYPRMELSNTLNLLGAYASSTKYIEIIANSAGDPQLYFNSSSGFMRLTHIGDTGSLGSAGNFVLSCTDNLRLSATSPTSIVELAPGSAGYVTVPNWSKLLNADSTQTLQTALNNKANVFSGVYGTVYVASTPGGPTDKAITFTNGIRTA
ncbi:phage tail protein [Paenibacillus sp. J5C_2022]|uniref:phage tail spike protein n=1 Tax=Paenibacillus sp. J5C2022 TaxID=2977129 RepID=UPI0021D27BD5|nr:phage tail spike protein [Paenibacillus sp. J5C2022]MCU6709366.1 phage tail protein [Paenibacillus sp. J5C2022]